MTEWQGLTIPSLEGFTGFVPPEGTGSLGVAIIGEAPGEQEAKSGRPFCETAPAGSCLSRLLNRAGLSREQFVISNAVWSRPPGNYLDGARYEGEAIAAYAPFRERLFRDYRPRVIVTLGGIALRTLTSYGGKGATITRVQGFTLDGPWDGTWVIPAIHPSAIIQGEQRMSGVVIWAIQRAVDIARNGFCRKSTRYVTHPSLDDAMQFEREYSPDHHVLSYDIETANSMVDEEEVEDKIDEISGQITRISFCFDGPSGYAITFPWERPYVDVARRLLGALGPKRAWNGYGFDNPRLEAADAPVRGRLYDVMWGWKQLQPTLPRNLQFVAPFYGYTGEPWKHLNHSEPEFYSCVDSHTLQLIGDGVDNHLRQKGQYQLYERHVVDLDVVLRRMSRNGLPYSRDRARAFQIELEGKLEERMAELQRRVPDELKRCEPKQGYVREPKDVTGMAQREFSVWSDEAKDIVKITRWCRVQPFLPGSSDQVKQWLKFNNLPVGRNRKTKAESADDDHLKKLRKRLSTVKKHTELCQTIQMIRECRQLSKVLGTYVKGWQPGSDGRIHSTPGFWGDMFRISWRRPNIAATIQDKQEEYVATGFRKCVATEGNRLLLEADWSGIEAVLVGWFAGDQAYTRLARLGVHSFMASHLLGRPADLSWGDEDLRACFKEIKRDHKLLYAEAKATVHGVNYGETPFGLAGNNDWPIARCKYLYDFYFDLFPKIKQWQKSVLDRTSRECKLRNPFGVEMPFWEVYRWDTRSQVWKLGDDAKGALAFLPRDTAACMLKEVLLRLKSLADEGILLACTHDSVTCEMSEPDLDRVATMVYTEMVRPVPELGGLSIDVAMKVGNCWHEDHMEPFYLAQEASHV